MTVPTPDPMPTFEPKWEAARIAETVRQALDDYEQRIKELEEDAHIAESIIQQQNIILAQQAAEIEELKNLLDIVGRDNGLLRDQLTAAQQWVPNTNYASGSITFPLSENMVRDAIEDDIWDESLGGQGGDDATDA